MRKCPDCGVEPGQNHRGSCVVERCGKCGKQALSCGCLYDTAYAYASNLSGIQLLKLEEGEIPDVVYTTFIETYKPVPWTGIWPGVAECQEYNLYSKLIPGKGWKPCSKDDPDATEDLNTLYRKGVWNIEKQKFDTF